MLKYAKHFCVCGVCVRDKMSQRGRGVSHYLVWQFYGCLLQGEGELKVFQAVDGLSVLPLIVSFHHPSDLNVCETTPHIVYVCCLS